ncbi:hypothetical protein DOK76_12715 [Vagococcus sp. DIV0080]|uniref:DUF4352 domain-containing protein n=1 Tax=Candidatus Vagococcus giribetii TaxID=2230876 RepID=A0ABS3HVZ0_9ENTE|nr:hypothetical protein [Vagococcus sp. DIV0080]MBO0477928.1 hypothetical protein [Vagococcus sp. DIV0080]
MTKILSEFIIPFLSLIISLLALYFSSKKEKFSLTVDILTKENSEWLVDRASNDDPDVYFFEKYRFFVTLVITNNSSLPITITEFSINEKLVFNSFSLINNNYQVTVKNNWEEVFPGISGYGTGKTIGISIKEGSLLLPPITIKPYESAVGTIGFHYDTSIIGNNTLHIKTSRGIKHIPLNIWKKYISKEKNDYIPIDISELL